MSDDDSDESFTAFLNSLDKEPQIGCSLIENFKVVQESLTACINDLYQIEQVVLATLSDAQRTVLGAPATSAEVLKWTRLSALYGILSRATIAHSPSDEDIVALAVNIVARRTKNNLDAFTKTVVTDRDDLDIEDEDVKPEQPKTPNSRRKMN